ncbi:MAG: hypothetical protein KF893_04750 [Caldilineaceae bacterium]|nr:hypothetical protein [Caldilineaceae bacterium]
MTSKMISQWAPSRSLLLTVGVTLIFYLFFTVVALARHDGNPLWFTWLGERYNNLDPNGRLGYDGQFVYYIVRDSAAAIPHLDNPPYRLQRIFYPIVVWGLSIGQVDFIPFAMIFVNLLAITSGTYVMAKWLQSMQLSAWYALSSACFVGTFLAYSRSLNEPLAVALAAFGMVAWLENKRARTTIFFALALLTKETILLFVAGLAFAVLIRREWSKCGWLVAAGIPLLVWEIYLYWIFAELPIFAGPGLVGTPLLGILPHLTLEPGRISAFLFVGLPAVVLLIMSMVKLRRHPFSPLLWILLLNALLIVSMPLDVYDHIMHAGRNATGLVLATIFCFPLFEPRIRQLLVIFWCFPTIIWLVPVLRWAPWLSQI